MRRAAVLILLLVGLVVPVGVAGPAHAQGRVTVTGPDGGAVVDPTYATTLTVRGSGFQAVQGGYGGVYVFFGHVRDGWRPSQGGRTGEDYFYVPDSESRDNQGFQQFVAFPGSDTSSSAQATMSRAGAWSTTLTVPGAVFEAFDRSGGSRTIDCREITCGVITVGAHGVSNATNETFTPVTVSDLYDAADPTATGEPTPVAGAEVTEPATEERETSRGRRTRSAAAALEVDRESAVAGHVLPFSAVGLTAGRQYSLVLDDGVAGAGPFVAGSDGTLAGVLTLPVDLGPGTHVLRLWAGEGTDAPEVSFAVQQAGAVPVERVAASGRESGQQTGRDPGAVLLVVAGALLLALALLRLALLVRGRRA